jgi:hypothetical protein
MHAIMLLLFLPGLTIDPSQFADWMKQYVERRNQAASAAMGQFLVRCRARLCVVAGVWGVWVVLCVTARP